MLKALLLIGSVACSSGFGAEFLLLDKTKVTAEKLTLAKELPSVFISATTGDETRTYKHSEIEVASLPQDLLDEFEKYRKEQLAKRIVLADDRWVSRDALLLKRDAKYGYKKALPKAGDSVIEFVNETKDTVTIGIRSGDRGYEMHIEAGKKKAYQIPDGKVHYLMAQESHDGKSLIVQKTKPEILKNVRLTVTVYDSDKPTDNELGSIPIPAEYQVPGGK